MNNKNMDDTHPASPEAWRLQVLKLLQANPSLSQRQLAERMGVSLGKANYCLRALIERGLVKLGNFSKNPNKRKYAYVLTPAGLEEKTQIALAFLKRKEAEFEAIRREIEVLKGDLEPAAPMHDELVSEMVREDLKAAERDERTKKHGYRTMDYHE